MLGIKRLNCPELQIQFNVCAWLAAFCILSKGPALSIVILSIPLSCAHVTQHVLPLYSCISLNLSSGEK